VYVLHPSISAAVWKEGGPAHNMPSQAAKGSGNSELIHCLLLMSAKQTVVPYIGPSVVFIQLAAHKGPSKEQLFSKTDRHYFQRIFSF
jgi:hypothetical protein